MADSIDKDGQDEDEEGFLSNFFRMSFKLTMFRPVKLRSYKVASPSARPAKRVSSFPS